MDTVNPLRSEAGRVLALVYSRRGAEVDRFVGSLIKARRISRGYTQEALAASVGITCAQLSRYEDGLARPSPSRLLAIAQGLGMDTDVISYWEQTGNLGVQLH